MLRLLQQECELFQGKGQANCWWSSFEETGEYHPQLGHGYLLKRTNGKPAVKIWVHVDDFAIHGPDLDSTKEALTIFLDLALRVGMLCHPDKLYPPQPNSRLHRLHF